MVVVDDFDFFVKHGVINKHFRGLSHSIPMKRIPEIFILMIIKIFRTMKEIWMVSLSRMGNLRWIPVNSSAVWTVAIPAKHCWRLVARPKDGLVKGGEINVPL